MRSTPIILGRVRHLRYDLQSVWDLDFLMTGGFASLLEKPVSLDLVVTLLWFGLKSEEPTLTAESTREILINAGAGKKNEDVVMNAFAMCLEELGRSGWIGSREKSQKETEEPGDLVLPPEQGRTLTVQEKVLELVKLAQFAGLTDADQIWRHTAKEIEDLYSASREKSNADDIGRNYRMGMICKIILEAHQMKPATKGSWDWTDFAPHEVKPQTADQMLAIIKAQQAAMGGITNARD